MQAKKALLIAIIFIVVLTGSINFVAAATKPLVFADKQATLTVERGQVEVRRSNSADWELVPGSVDVQAGDTIRTSADSAASINYFDQGEARLDENTTITLEKLEWNRSNPTTFVAEVLLESGRLWSRLLDFLSPESAYVAKTATTVATVRGTAFSLTNIPKVYEGVYASEHLVAVEVKKDGATMGATELVAGTAAKIDPAAKSAMATRDNPWNGDELRWAVANQPKDDAFVATIKAKHLAEAKAALSSTRGAIDGVATRLAERARLAFTFDQNRKRALEDRFVSRRLIAAMVAEEEGRAAIAEKIMAAAKNMKDAANADTDNALLMMARIRTTVSDEMIEKMQQVAPRAAEKLERLRERQIRFKDMIKPLRLPESMIVPKAIFEIKTDTSAPTTETTIVPTITAIPVPVAPTVTKKLPVSLKLVSDRVNILPGERTAITASLVWSDGSTEEVSSQVKWSATPDDVTGEPVGFMDGNVFVSYKTGGKTVVSAMFSDGTTTLTASLTITALTLEIGI